MGTGVPVEHELGKRDERGPIGLPCQTEHKAELTGIDVTGGDR